MRRHTLLLVMVGSVAGLGLLALFETLGGKNPSAKASRRDAEFAVTNPADRGPGTLREAIFAANFAAARVRIVFLVPRLTLRTPLPPVVHRGGIEIVAADSAAEIDAQALATGAVLDLQAPGALVERLRIRGAGGIGILVRAPGVRLVDVSLAGCGIGVEQAAGAEGLEVEQGSFIENAVGARLQAGDAGTAIRRSSFRGHREAALWAVGPATGPAPGGLTVSDSWFENDRLGLVVGNLTATIQDNDIRGSAVAGVYLTGRGVTLRRNRVRAGAGIGVLAALTEGAVITDNEIDHNQAVGIVVSSGLNTLVQQNRIYQNGYGIVVVFGAGRSPTKVAGNSVLDQSLDGLFVVGASPILERNRAMNNRAAGMRILDFMPQGGSAAPPADPLLVRNVLEGNGVNEPVHGVFRDPG